jgi:hypothetical protein
MVSPVPTSLNATPEAIATVRARLLAEALAPGQRPPTTRLCPTVRRLLEDRRREVRARA